MPWYASLQHFGPVNGQWGAHPMELVDDYTFHVAGLKVYAGDQFMFVSPAPTPTPPLGDKNWKQGKIGVFGTGLKGPLEPGGGGGEVSLQRHVQCHRAHSAACQQAHDL